MRHICRKGKAEAGLEGISSSRSHTKPKLTEMRLQQIVNLFKHLLGHRVVLHAKHLNFSNFAVRSLKRELNES